MQVTRQLARFVQSCFLGENISISCLLKILHYVIIWEIFASFAPKHTFQVLTRYVSVQRGEKKSKKYILIYTYIWTFREPDKPFQLQSEQGRL